MVPRPPSHSGLARALPGDLRAHGRRDADAGRAGPGGGRVRRGPRGRRRRLRRGAVRPRAARRGRPGAGRRGGGGARRVPGGHGAARPSGAGGSGSAACSPPCGTPRGRGRSPSWPCATATSGVVGFDIAGAEAGLPAHPPPGRVRVRAPAERALHDPRRRGVRAAVDLGGVAVVRRRPARATASASSTTSRSVPTASPATGPARRLRAGQADPAGDVPDVQRAHRRGEVARRSPDRAARRSCASGSR